MPYIGRTLGQGTRSRFLYTATAGQTTFSGSDTQSNTLAYADNNGLDCFQNGVLLKGGGADYTATSGTSVVLTTGASVNDIIEILVYDVFAIADHVKKSGDAMTGPLTNIDVNGTELILDADGDTSIEASTDDTIVFDTGGSERMRLIDDGKLLVGKTSSGDYVTGFEVQPAGAIVSYRSSGVAGLFGRTDDGEILRFNSNSATVGKIDSSSSNLLIRTNGNKSGVRFDTESFTPFKNGSEADGTVDLGYAGGRYGQLFAVASSINTSDETEKQDIEIFTDAEMKVAKKVSALFKKYRWKNAVSEKGNSARIHSGIIAQEVQSAFSAEGLEASKYGLWCSDTWWEETEKFTDDDGEEKTRRNTYRTKETAPEGATEKTRLGIRYAELISFICAYNEQRFTDIEARLTALEGKP